MTRPNSSVYKARFALLAFAVSLAMGAAGACAESDRLNGSPDDFDGGPYVTTGGLGGTGGLLGTGGYIPPPTGGYAGTGGAGTGGMSGSGGTMMDAGPPPPTCEVHTGAPALDVTMLPECDNPDLPLCGDGRCLASSAVPEASRSALAPCMAADTLCVPEHFIETLAMFIVPTCTSLLGAEGRCLSLCIPQVAAQAGFLPQDTCAMTERCAPCFDPRTGEDTTACHQGCDGGPAEPPTVFDKCCGGAGSCVPSEIVPEADRALLGTDTCTTAGQLCAPDTLSDSTFVPTTCTSLAGAEGRCLPDCLPDVAAQASLLPVDTCAAGELCAPCFDPLSGDPTGACTRGGDMPTQPPVVFDPCCDTKGACVPTDILSAEQEAQLGPDTCPSGSLCAPKVLASPGQRAATCDSLGGAEGRCLPLCVPMVAAQQDRLPQATCAADERCAPCYDPITGEVTGACSQNGDMPTEPAYTFPKCCSNNGVCVPSTLVPTAQQSLLGRDTCPGTGDLCAPTLLASDPTARPAVCHTFSPQNREGRCLANCIPQIQAQATRLLQENCAAGELCAPCYDPVVGGLTGACGVNGDAPLDPDPGPFVYCASTTVLWPFPPGVDGRCVPPHLVDPAQAGLLTTSPTCQTGEICAPCINPLDGLPTGACPP